MKKYIVYFILVFVFIVPQLAKASYRFDEYQGRPPIHIYGKVAKVPHGLSPNQIKKAYNLPKDGGQGTIAIIGAYDDKTIENDLNVFSKQFNLPPCTTLNGCFEKHLMSGETSTNSGWSMETSLDVQWAHAIAPQAKILLVSAKTQSGKNLIDAVDYATSKEGVVAVSMSWGGPEFSDETTLDTHFKSRNNIIFFASSGDKGAGTSWPAVSPYVVAVGGTRLNLAKDGSVASESAWSGSGGGVSLYEVEPTYQKTYTIPKANGMRSIPDVAYNADPKFGFSIYKGGENGGWYVVGGTSAGAPQWAAIHSLSLSVSLENIYKDMSEKNTALYFRDVKNGSNGTCGYYCDAHAKYDYVTGLGSPITASF